MGYGVTCDDLDLWDPSLRVGHYFLTNIKSLEVLIGKESGIDSYVADWIEIDGTKLTSFVDKLLKEFEESNNTPLIAMVSGIAEVLLALEAKINGDKDLRKGSERTASLIERSKLIFDDLEMYRKAGQK